MGEGGQVELGPPQNASFSPKFELASQQSPDSCPGGSQNLAHGVDFENKTPLFTSPAFAVFYTSIS
jgi:hypothetical protein